MTAHYVAMTPNGRVFDSSLDRGFPYDIRIGSGQVITMHACLLYCNESLRRSGFAVTEAKLQTVPEVWTHQVDHMMLSDQYVQVCHLLACMVGIGVPHQKPIQEVRLPACIHLGQDDHRKSCEASGGFADCCWLG